MTPFVENDKKSYRNIKGQERNALAHAIKFPEWQGHHWASGITGMSLAVLVSALFFPTELG